MIADALRLLLPGVSIESVAARDGQETLVAPPDRLLEICQALRYGVESPFVLLVDVTAVDYWPREPRFELVYHFASSTSRVRLKIPVSAESAHVPTIQSIWPGAGWLEREVWDMFGIEFDGHGDLRRLLMPEDWQGHPLRKDFPVQIRLKPRASEPLQVSEEEFRANLARDRAARTGGAGTGR